MKYFILLSLFLTIQCYSSDVFKLYNNLGELDLRPSGQIRADDPEKYSFQIRNENSKKIIVINSKLSDRKTIYASQTSNNQMVSAFQKLSDSMVMYTSFEPHSLPELKDEKGQLLARAVNFGVYTLICQNYSVSGFDPKTDKICVMANRENCDNFYQGMPEDTQQMIANCNRMFFRMFTNAQISKAEGFAGQARVVPASRYYLGRASDDVRNMTGENISFHPFREGDINKTGVGNIMEFLSKFHTACEHYRSSNSNKTGLGASGTSGSRSY